MRITTPSDQAVSPPTDETARGTPTGKPWPMTLINFWLDAILFVAVVIVVWVAVLLRVAFPSPTAAAGWSLWGLTYDQWHNVQFGALCVAAGLMIEHLVLHWNWICTVLATRILRVNRPDEGRQAVYGVATFICILLLVKASLLVALFSVKAP